MSAISQDLAAISQYWKTSLASDFQDGKTIVGGKLDGAAGLNSGLANIEEEARKTSKKIRSPVEDSEAESDDNFSHETPRVASIVCGARVGIDEAVQLTAHTDCTHTMSDSSTSSHHAHADFHPEGIPIRYVVISGTPYKTYRALLQWIYTGKITFADLRSKHSMAGSPETSAKRSSWASAISCKSIYRLAHELEITELQRLALAEYASQLSVDNAVHELLSDICFAYPELRDAAIGVVKENWAAILKDGKIAEARKEVERDGRHAKEKAAVLLDLCSRMQFTEAKT